MTQSQWHSRLLQRAINAVRIRALQLGLCLSPEQRSHGMQIVVFGGKSEEDMLVGKIHEALALITRIDPKRFRRLSSDLKYVACVRAVHALGQYIEQVRACVLDLDYVRRTTDPTQIAIVIVHEATHARLRRAGVRFSAERAARIERTCVREEVRFAQKIPGADLLLRWAEERLRVYSRWSGPGAPKEFRINQSL